MPRDPRRRSGGLARLLPALLVLAALAGGATGTSGPADAPLVDLTVRR